MNKKKPSRKEIFFKQESINSMTESMAYSMKKKKFYYETMAGMIKVTGRCKIEDVTRTDNGHYMITFKDLDRGTSLMRALDFFLVLKEIEE